MKTRVYQNLAAAVLLATIVCTLIAQADMPPGIRAWWKFDEGSGTIVHDGSGNGFNGTFNAEPQWSPGVEGSALELIEQDMVWQIPEAFDNSCSTGFTIAGWVLWYGATPPRVQYYMFDAFRQGWNGGFGLYLREDGHVRFSILKSAGVSQGIDSVRCLPPGTWAHVAATFNYESGTGTMRLFVDGTEDSASPVSATEPYHQDWSNAAIGNNHWAPGDGSWKPLNGAVDEVCFYDRALAGEEVVDLYSSYQPPRIGDMNCDGSVDFGDIDPLVLAVTCHACYLTEYPGCRYENADINADGYVDFADIDPFVALLSAGS